MRIRVRLEIRIRVRVRVMFTCRGVVTVSKVYESAGFCLQ